jgi:hypothetical protein
MGWALIHKGYHNPFDIMAAMAFGGLTIYTFRKIILLDFFLKNPARLGFSLLPLVGAMMIILSYRTGIPAHTWKMPFLLFGFSILWPLINRYKISLLKNESPN